ncbi:MAG TPA: PQQ-binding-like beta-propeller repeat protein, partial [Ktedonobacteraceae bacterium]|nr:PQQ-binding-like beta-propeller repeat protein [Ktedonobacteraceae bacterium]
MPTATSQAGLHQDLKSITPTVPKTVTPLATPKPAVPQILSGDWSTYLMGNNGFNSDETLINATTATQLQKYWMYHAQGSISAQPLVVNGIIYWGSWDGLEHATNLSGQQLWATNLGKTSDDDCDPPVAGVASTATVAPITTNGRTTLTLFVGGGDANFYALNASTGKVIWKVALGFSPDDFIWSSPVVYKGSIYIGVSSFGDCPSVQGKLVQLSTLDGSVQNIFDVVPDGCGGGSIWGSPTIDTQTGKIYVATGNADHCSTVESYAIAIVELNASDLSVVDDWQVPQSQWLDDSDFGTTPTLFNASING